MKFLRLCLLAFVLIILFVSCATGPKRTEVDELFRDKAPPHEFAELAAGGTAYFSVDVSEMRPVLDNISFGDMNGSDAEDVLNMTETGVIGIYPEESGRKFMIAANGNYPVFWSSIAMTFSSAWKKIKSDTGVKYWRSERQNLSLALSPQKAFVSDGEPYVEMSVLRTAVVEVPENYFEIRRSSVIGDLIFEVPQTAVMAGWIDKAGTKINPFLANIGIPIQIPADRLLFAFYKVTESPPENPLYDGIIYLEVPTVSQARAVVTILGFARNFAAAIDDSQPIGKILTLLLSNQPRFEGTIIKLHAGTMSSEEMILLLSLFLKER